MKNAINYFYIILLACGISGCTQWEIPEPKNLYNCSSPASINSQTNASNFRNYVFNLNTATKDIAKVDWQITKSTASTTIINPQQLQATNNYTAINLADGDYTITAKITTVCQSTNTLTTLISVRTPQLTVASSFTLTDALVHVNNSTVAVANDGTVIANEGYNIKIWNYASKTLLRSLKGHTNSITSLVLSTDEKYLFSSAYENTIIVWDWKTGTEVRRMNGHTSVVYALNISADNKYLVSTSADKTIRVWNVADGTLVRTIATSESYTDISVSNDAKYIVGRNNDGRLSHTIWNGQTGANYWTFTNGQVTGLTVNPAGTEIWVQGLRNNQWYLESYNLDKQFIKSYTGYIGSGLKLKVSNDGRYLTNGALIIDSRTETVLSNFLNNFNSSASSCSISANNAYLVSGSYNGSVALATLTAGTKIQNTSYGHKVLIQGASISKNLNNIIVLDYSGLMIEWEISSGSVKKILVRADNTPVSGAVYSANYYWLLNCSSVERFNLNGQFISRISFPTNTCLGTIAVSNDEQQLAIETINSSNGSVNIYNANNGTFIKAIALNANTTIASLAFSNDNKYIITLGSNGTTYIIDIASGMVLRSLSNTNSFTISEDSKFVVTGDNQKVSVSNLETGATVASINSSSGLLAFSPDGRYIAAGSSNINILDVSTGNVVKTITLAYPALKLFYNATGTQLYVVTQKDFQVFNL